jgi:hypothetical protein
MQQTLALRLNDTAQVHWTKAECILYLSEALRLWNCLSSQGEQDWTTTYNQPSTPSLPTWQSLGNSLNSLTGFNSTNPRYQTLSSTDVFTLVQYHLLEPPSGSGTWTGTTQFSLQDFVNSFQRRLDQLLQLTANNVGPFSTTLSLTPGTNRIQLADSTAQTILDLRRIRFIPASGQGNPSTLYRDDSLSMEYFTTYFNQTSANPLAWDTIGSPLQFVTFDALANVPNSLDCLAVLSSGNFTPPTAAPLLIPDDYFWVLKFGMMADLLTKETESKDLARAQYCEQRFAEGVRMMMELPWLLQARIDNIPVDTPDFYTADSFDYEWQSNPNAQPAIIRGGIDLFAISPTIPASTSVSVTLSLIGNQSIPASDGAFVQIPREVFDVVIDEAEHLAQFKEGGAEFEQSMLLHQRMIKLALEMNAHLKGSGIFPTDLRRPISKEDSTDPRYVMASAGEKEGNQ